MKVMKKVRGKVLNVIKKVGSSMKVMKKVTKSVESYEKSQK